MKAYIFEDWSFCYVAVVLASSEAEAIGYMGGRVPGECTLRVQELVPGFLVEGGGNG